MLIVDGWKVKKPVFFEGMDGIGYNIELVNEKTGERATLIDGGNGGMVVARGDGREEIEGLARRFCISAGLSEFEPLGSFGEEILNLDRAVREAKQNGRFQVCVVLARDVENDVPELHYLFMDGYGEKLARGVFEKTGESSEFVRIVLDVPIGPGRDTRANFVIDEEPTAAPSL